MIYSYRRKKLSVKDETHETIDDEVNEYGIYKIDQISLDDK